MIPPWPRKAIILPTIATVLVFFSCLLNTFNTASIDSYVSVDAGYGFIPEALSFASLMSRSLRKSCSLMSFDHSR